MGKLQTKVFAEKARRFTSDHGPEILTGVGIAGMFTTTVLAVKATPKALMLIEEAEDEKQASLTKTELVKTVWKPYAPAALTFAMSTACLISASSINARRYAALTTVYKLSESALAEYKEKVIETIGEKKEKTVREKINKDRVEKNPVSKTEVIMTDNGKTLCYDHLSGRYFKSDIEMIKRSVNKINERLLRDNYVSLNDFYYEIGLTPTKIGEDLGWNLAKDGLIKVEFDSIITNDDEICAVVYYEKEPKYNYYKLT